MIDLHCHLLPGLDDGPPDMETSLAMARMAVADGITHTACTPHVRPGVYNTSVGAIEVGVAQLQAALDAEGIGLTLMVGGDVHIDPGLAGKLAQRTVPSLNGSRYFLFEPPHEVAPPRIVGAVAHLLAAGFCPVVTHPERLKWIEGHYDMVTGMAAAGALMQVTAGAFTGHFGTRARYWAERLLDEGRVDIIATDAHNATSRPPVLSEAREVIAARLSYDEAMNMVQHRPAAIANDEDVQRSAARIAPRDHLGSRGLLGEWMRRLGVLRR